MCDADGCGNVFYTVGGKPDPSLVKSHDMTYETSKTTQNCYFTDPRFTTDWAYTWKDTPDPWFYHKPGAGTKQGFSHILQIPKAALDKEECWNNVPGYNSLRPDKNYKLTVNDYPYHNVNLFGQGWSPYVYTRKNY